MADKGTATAGSGNRSSSSLPRKGEWRLTLISLGVVLALSFLVRNTLVESFGVPTEAMSPLLIPGDIVLVNKQLPAAARIPAYGSVVVYLDSTEGDRLLVRRVIGRPGDRIRITDGRVLRNGKFVTTRWASNRDRNSPVCALESVGRGGAPARTKKRAPGSEVRFAVCQDAPALPNQASLTVPPGHVYVLGDRRAVPTDISEAWLAGNRLLLPIGAGLVQRPRIVGTVTRVLLSIRPPGESSGMGWTERIRWDRFWKRIEIP